MIYSEKEFDYIKIKLASPTRIKQWGQRLLPNGQVIGEVQKAETINYRTFKPEMDGLFCERIFGPNKNLECACGKYKRVRYEGLICDRCGVELTESRVRRHRMGHINLVYPATHIWYINSRPNYMALLLEVEQYEKKIDTGVPIKQKDLRVAKPLKSGQVNITDERIQRIKLVSLAYFIAEDEINFYGLHWDFQMYRRSRRLGLTGYPTKPEPRPKKFISQYNTPKYLIRTTPNYLIGSVLIKKELDKLSINFEIFDTRSFISYCSRVLTKDETVYQSSQWFRKWEQQRIYKLRDQAIKRLRILENLAATGSNPAWMVLSILPVIPPALRPMIQLEGGRFATSDLNELYRRVITRNNRLLRLLEMHLS